MKVHYFQRYHSKENVSTANTMLLLSRLYQYSPDKFFRFLKQKNYISDSFDPQIKFTLQEKNVNSVPDATITQDSFKIVVETKMSDDFSMGQLIKHLKSFKEENCRILLTVAPVPMSEKFKKDFENYLSEYNASYNTNIIHANTTFKDIVDGIGEVIDERDYEINDMIDDYFDYCINDGLIVESDSWKFMRSQLAGVTLKFNMENNLYYQGEHVGFRPHDYLGLYSQKSVRAIGKISACVLAVKTKNGMEYELEHGELTAERMKKIEFAMEDGINYGYDLKNYRHRYFFVEKFYETDFRKITPKAPMGSRIFDLTEILSLEKLPETSVIAELLKNQTWT